MHGNNFVCMHTYNTIQYIHTYIHTYIHKYIRIQNSPAKAYEEKNDPCSFNSNGEYCSFFHCI